MLSVGGRRLIGIIGIAGAILIVVLGVLRPNPFQETHTYFAEFTTVQGLGATGRDIRLAGVNVGEIGGVERKGDNAIVELNLHEDIDVHEDARAEMRPHTLFEGSSFIELHPGSPASPVLGEKGVIPLEQTSNYVTLDEALRVLRPEIRQSLKDLAEVGSKTLRGQAITGIQRTLKNAPGLTKRLVGPTRALQGSHRRELAGAISGLADTVDALASKESDLGPMVERLNRTTAAFAVDGAKPFDASLASLPGVLSELRAGAPVLTETVDKLERLSVEITPTLPDFARAVNDATPLLDRSIPVLKSATPLIADLRSVTERLADAAPDLEGLIRTLDPVVGIFGESILPALQAPSRRGPPVYQQLSALFSATNAVWRPYQTLAQNPLGSGHTWAITSYVDIPGGIQSYLEGGPEPSPKASCTDVSAISAKASRQLQLMGVCR